MASVRVRAAGVAVLAVLLATLTGCSAQTLSIYPNAVKHLVAVGNSQVLTCRVDSADPDLVTMPLWRDPRGNIVEPAPSEFPQPLIYTTLIEDQQSSQLEINNITPAMAGKYTCITTYANTPMSLSVTVETYVGITWNNANDDQIATKGQNYKVMCDVTAEPPPHVQWFKDGRKVKTGGRYVIHTNGLLITNIRESDEGIYTCKAVVSRTGQRGVKTIKLEVFTPPMMVEQERKVMINAGGTASIKCKATGKPDPRYTWIKESTRHDLGKTSRFTANEVSGELRFDRIEPNDYGTYICSAANRAGQNETVFQVEVLVPPKIFELLNKTSAEGTDASLECKATGRPAPLMTFRKLSNKDPFVEGLNDDGRTIVEVMSCETGDQMQSTGILTITKDLMRSDDGLYECIARSPVPNGGEARKNGHLTVQFKPNFDNTREDTVWTWNGQPVNISCLAESIPNASIKWRYHDADLVDSSHVRIYGSGPYSYITVVPTERSLYGYYKCSATNPLGEAVHTIQLREAYPPGPVVSVQPKKISATSVEFEIVGPAEDMGPPILAYTTQYKGENDYGWTLAKNRTWSANSPYVVENLTPTATMHFRFAAVNQVGVGQWGPILTVTTGKRSAPEAPQWRSISNNEDTGSNLLAHSEYSDRYEIHWKIPADNGEPIDMYEIEICTAINVSGEWRITNDVCEKKELKSYDITHYELSGLYPETRYRVAVRAHNALGLSEPITRIVQTAPGKYIQSSSSQEQTGGPTTPSVRALTVLSLLLQLAMLIFFNFA